jgi:hypothetical protein
VFYLLLECAGTDQPTVSEIAGKLVLIPQRVKVACDNLVASVLIVPTGGEHPHGTKYMLTHIGRREALLLHEELVERALMNPQSQTPLSEGSETVLCWLTANHGPDFQPHCNALAERLGMSPVAVERVVAELRGRALAKEVKGAVIATKAGRALCYEEGWLTRRPHPPGA